MSKNVISVDYCYPCVVASIKHRSKHEVLYALVDFSSGCATGIIIDLIDWDTPTKVGNIPIRFKRNILDE